MASCVIFCAGGFSGLIEPVAKDDCVLAADGGFAHVQALGLTPTGILGDFDSLGYVPDSARVFPVEKDDTDSMLAVRHGLKLGFRRFLLYGCLDGPRLDHTVANLQTLQFLADRGAVGYLIGKDHIVTTVTNSDLRFPGSCRGLISLFCMGPDAREVTLSGLQYPLENGTLSAGFPLGVSNHFTGTDACISVGKGTLLVIWERTAGMEGIVHGNEAN